MDPLRGEGFRTSGKGSNLKAGVSTCPQRKQVTSASMESNQVCMLLCSLGGGGGAESNGGFHPPVPRSRPTQGRANEPVAWKPHHVGLLWC